MKHHIYSACAYYKTPIGKRVGGQLEYKELGYVCANNKKEAIDKYLEANPLLNWTQKDTKLPILHVTYHNSDIIQVDYFDGFRMNPYKEK